MLRISSRSSATPSTVSEASAMEVLNRYFDPYFERPTIKLLPGQYYATEHDEMLVTVLGSCVSACLRDPIARCGGMNHFLLPAPTPNHSHRFDAASYGVHAMELLINDLLKRGALRERLEAKVFGGGAVVDALTRLNVGRNNANFVNSFLRTEGIPVVAGDLEGPHPRKVYFFPRSGEVRVKYLKVLANDTIAQREQALLQAASIGRQAEPTFFDD